MGLWVSDSLTVVPFYLAPHWYLLFTLQGPPRDTFDSNADDAHPLETLRQHRVKSVQQIPRQLS